MIETAHAARFVDVTAWVSSWIMYTKLWKKGILINLLIIRVTACPVFVFISAMRRYRSRHFALFSFRVALLLVNMEGIRVWEAFDAYGCSDIRAREIVAGGIWLCLRFHLVRLPRTTTVLIMSAKISRGQHTG